MTTRRQDAKLVNSDDLVSEAEFQEAVCAYADAQGWRWTHFRPAKTDKGWRTPLSGSPGFPDVVFTRDGRLVFAELKSQKARKPAVDQQAWLDDLARVPGVTVCLWRPAMWPDIEKVLY